MNCYCNRKIIMSSSPNHCVKSFQPQKMGKQTGIQDVQSFTVYHKKRGFDRHTHTSAGSPTKNVVVLSTAIKIYISEPKTRFSKTEMRNFLEEKRT